MGFTCLCLNCTYLCNNNKINANFFIYVSSKLVSQYMGVKIQSEHAVSAKQIFIFHVVLYGLSNTLLRQHVVFKAHSSQPGCHKCDCWKLLMSIFQFAVRLHEV